MATASPLLREKTDVARTYILPLEAEEYQSPWNSLPTRPSIPPPPDAVGRGSDLAVTAPELNAGAGVGRLGWLQETDDG